VDADEMPGRPASFTGAQYRPEAAKLATAAPTCARLPLFVRAPTNKALLSLACPRSRAASARRPLLSSVSSLALPAAG